MVLQEEVSSNDEMTSLCRCQSSGELNGILGYQGPLRKVGKENPECPLPVSGGN